MFPVMPVSGRQPADHLHLTVGQSRLSYRHTEIHKRSVEIVVKRFHNPKQFCRLYKKPFGVIKRLIPERIFQIPAFEFYVFRLRMSLVISGGNIL